MFGAFQLLNVLNVLILTLLRVHFIQFSKGNCVATCLGKSCCLGLLPVILLFVKMCLSILPIDVWDKLRYFCPTV